MRRAIQTLNLKRITEVNAAVVMALRSRSSHQFSMDMREFARTLEPLVKDYQADKEAKREDLNKKYKEEHNFEMPFSETEEDYVNLPREERELIHKFNKEFDEKMKELDAVEKKLEVMYWKETEILEERDLSYKRWKSDGFAPNGSWYVLMGDLIELANEKKKASKAKKEE